MQIENVVDRQLQIQQDQFQEITNVYTEKMNVVTNYLHESLNHVLSLIEILQKIISNKNKIDQELYQQLEEKISKEIKGMYSTLKEMQKNIDIQDLEEKIQVMIEENSKLKNDIKQLNSKLEEQKNIEKPKHSSNVIEKKVIEKIKEKDVVQSRMQKEKLVEKEQELDNELEEIPEEVKEFLKGII